MFLTMYYKIKLSFIQRWYFCRGKEVDFASVLQVRPRKTFRKKDQNHSRQVDNCPKQDAHKHESWNKNGSKSTSHKLQTMTFWTLWNEHLLPKRSAKMIDRTEKPKIPSKFAKRDTNNLPVILYETMSWLPTHGQGISCLILPGFLHSCRIRSISKSLLLEVIDLKRVYYPDLF